MSKKSVLQDIDWTKAAEIGMPVIGPFVQGGLWYGAMLIDKRAKALGRVVAIAEIIPAVDLNLPKGVVLASLYDSTSDTIKLLMDFVDAIQEIPDTVKETLQEIKDDVTGGVVEPVQEKSHAFQTALANCVMNAKESLGFTYWVAGPAWITSCMIQKGFPVTTDYVKDKIFG